MHHPRKRTLRFVALGLVLALAATLVIVPRVTAASCFPDVGGHWAETFICWLQSHGIVAGYPDGTYRPDNNVTRGEMAVFVRNVADIPPTTGPVLITVSGRDWVPLTSPDPLLTFTQIGGPTAVQRSAAGFGNLSVAPVLPTVLYGKSLRLNGVEFCYSTRTGTTLVAVYISTFFATNDAGGNQLQLTSWAVFDDNACRLYNLSTPVTLTADDGVELDITVNFSAPGDEFWIGRTTFVFQATDINAAAP